jgi:hypothetical protein
MARFFFHTRRGDEIAKDDEGFELPNLAAARKEALATAREIVADAVKFGKDRTPDSVLIADADGREVMTVSLKDALPRNLCED